MYIVTECIMECWDGDILEIAGLFSTQKLAENFCKKQYKKDKRHSKFYIENWEVDSLKNHCEKTFIQGRFYDGRIE